MTAANSINLSASLEDYLEAIFQIIQQKQAVKARDIGQRLNVSKSSVTGALHALADKNLINYAPYDVITLTEQGKSIAKDVARRHEVLKDFFVKVLAVGDDDADNAACKMEHAVSEVVLQRFLEFVEFIERCPRGGEKWIKGFSYYCDNGKSTGNCERCISEVLKDVHAQKDRNGQTVENHVPLSSLKPGKKAFIVKITGTGSIRRRLLDMGAVAGTILEVERIAPLGDPMELKIKGYHLTLRKEEADRIIVQPVQS